MRKNYRKIQPTYVFYYYLMLRCAKKYLDKNSVHSYSNVHMRDMFRHSIVIELQERPY